METKLIPFEDTWRKRMISEGDEIIAPVHGRADHSMADIEDT